MAGAGAGAKAGAWRKNIFRFLCPTTSFKESEIIFYYRVTQCQWGRGRGTQIPCEHNCAERKKNVIAVL